MTESENENDHFDLDHFDHFSEQASPLHIWMYMKYIYIITRK